MSDDEKTPTGVQHFDGTISKRLPDGTIQSSSYINYDAGERPVDGWDVNEELASHAGAQADSESSAEAAKVSEGDGSNESGQSGDKMAIKSLTPQEEQAAKNKPDAQATKSQPRSNKGEG